jgi:predicted membrane protein
MNNDIEHPHTPRNGKALAGIILLVIGAMLLFRQFDFFFIPNWLFSWPMWLVGIGLYIGAKSNFQKPSSFIMIGLGVIFLFNENVDHSGHIIWPLAIIGFGLWMILRRHSSVDHDRWKKRYGNKWDWQNPAGQNSAVPNPDEPVVDYTSASSSSAVPPIGGTRYGPTGDDYLDAISVFGGVKKTILSKDFKGGEIVNIFGGAELDFTQADINGRVIIDITQIFGGTKIIVPSHWQVVPDLAAVFASIDDKRMKMTASPNNDKILVLKGVSIFAGVDVRSF